MSTKNYVLKIALSCVIAAFAVQPLYANESVYNEIDKTVSQEEIQTIDRIDSENSEQSSVEEQQSNSDTTDSVEESDNQVTETSENTSQEVTEPEKEFVKENQVSSINQNNVVEEPQKKEDVKKEIKFLSRLKCRLLALKNMIVSSFSSSKLTFNKTNTPVCVKEKSYLDFAPYYFIYPSFEEKNVFMGSINNILELMPYSMSIEKIQFKIDAPKNTVTPQGTTDTLVLMNAPSPQIEVKGEPLFAKLVIDIRNNTLYKYDKNGFPLKAYLVATGARGTRTRAGLRIVTYKERFPYSGAPNSKRALDPYSYGPYIIFLNVVEPKTGRQYVIEQLLHGNGNEYSIGKKVSHGCIRTNNNVMRTELSKEVKRGDYILLINPDIV